MSGNGEYIPHNGTLITLTVGGVALPDVQLEPGLGSGCVTSGPFSNFTQNLLVDLSYSSPCMTRNIGPWVVQTFTNYTSVASMLPLAFFRLCS